MRNLDLLTRGLSVVAPGMALRRAQAQEALRFFEGEPEHGDSTARGKPATVFDQASSENWEKQRKRIEAIWQGRAMEENLCVIAGLLDKLAMYAVGRLEYQSATGDEKIDHEYEEYFHDWCSRADITGRHRLITLAELGLRSMFRDGEHGWVEHLDGEELRLQAIEGDRIGNPNQMSRDESNISGIKIDGLGRVTGYEIHRRTLTAQYELEGEIGPDKFIHLFRPTRSDQYHGVSILAPVIPHAQDLYELFGFEKIAAKFAASFSGFISEGDPYDPNGSNTWDTQGRGKRLPGLAAQPGTIVRIPKAGGSEVKFAPASNRPSGAFIALVQAIFREIALGTSLPYGFIYDMAAFGGVTARLETQQAERVFVRFRQLLVNTLLNRVKNKVLMLGIAFKRIRPHRNFERGNWQFGATLTGDIGHQVQADATMIQYGVKTRTQWAAELGCDFGELVDQAAAEIEKMQRVSQERNVPLELLNATLNNPTETIAAMAKAKAGISDEPAPPAGLIGVVGDKGAAGVIDLLEKVGMGTIDRDSARMALMGVYGLSQAAAWKLLPQVVDSLPM